jgi:integrase
MNTGMRRCELLLLTWANVELNNEYKTLTIISDNTKSGKTRHTPLNNEASRVLYSWQTDTSDQGLVFKGQYGKKSKKFVKLE